MGAVPHLSLPCCERLHKQQRFVRLLYNQRIVSKHPKTTHYYVFIVARFGHLMRNGKALEVRSARDLEPLGAALELPARGPGGAGAGAAADRQPLALTRGRRMPKNRNLLARARIPAFSAGYLRSHLLQAVGQPRENRQMPPLCPLSWWLAKK